MNHQQILEYICELLNINLKNKLVSDKILMTLEDMSVSYDLVKFGDFLESSFNYERFRYLTGYQKFLSMANEFKRDNELKLSDEMEMKALSYTDELFQKVTTVTDELNFYIQTNKKSIDEINLFETLKKYGLKNHHINILKHIGDKKKVFTLSVYGKHEFKELIGSIVFKKALVKQYPQLLIKKDKIEVLERLKNGK